MSRETPKNPGRPYFNLLLLAGSVIVSLVIGEIFLRVLGHTSQAPQPFTDYLPRPWGAVMARHVAPGMINSHQAFDVEHSLAKPRQVFRVALLGDSFLGLPSLPHTRQTPQRLEEELSRHPPRDLTFEVLNFSVSSAGTANEYLRYLDDASRFAPDLVVVFFTVGNDARNNSVRLQPLMEANPFPLPGFVLEKDGSLKRQDIPPAVGSYSYYPAAWQRWLAAHWALYSVCSRTWQKMQGAQSVLPEKEKWRVTAAYLTETGPYSNDVLVSWEVTEALMGALRDQAAKDGARMAVVLIPTAWDIQPEWKHWLQKNLGRGSEFQQLNYDLPYQEAQRRFARQGLPVLDLRPALRAALLPGRPLYDDTGHWGAAGHEVAARETARFLQEQQLVPPPKNLEP
jgi:hypothetical protein